MNAQELIERLRAHCYPIQTMNEAADALEAQADRIKQLEADAARYQYLQNISAAESQAYFWNYMSRTERSKAIDKAIKEQGK